MERGRGRGSRGPRGRARPLAGQEVAGFFDGMDQRRRGLSDRRPRKPRPGRRARLLQGRQGLDHGRGRGAVAAVPHGSERVGARPCGHPLSGGEILLSRAGAASGHVRVQADGDDARGARLRDVDAPRASGAGSRGARVRRRGRPSRPQGDPARLRRLRAGRHSRASLPRRGGHGPAQQHRALFLPRIRSDGARVLHRLRRRQPAPERRGHPGRGADAGGRGRRRSPRGGNGRGVHHDLQRSLRRPRADGQRRLRVLPFGLSTRARSRRQMASAGGEGPAQGPRGPRPARLRGRSLRAGGDSAQASRGRGRQDGPSGAAVPLRRHAGRGALARRLLSPGPGRRGGGPGPHGGRDRRRAGPYRGDGGRRKGASRAQHPRRQPRSTEGVAPRADGGAQARAPGQGLVGLLPRGPAAPRSGPAPGAGARQRIRGARRSGPAYRDSGRGGAISLHAPRLRRDPASPGDRRAAAARPHRTADLSRAGHPLLPVRALLVRGPFPGRRERS